mgnify:FL=1
MYVRKDFNTIVVVVVAYVLALVSLLYTTGEHSKLKISVSH